MYSSNQHEGMYYGYTEGGTEVRTYNLTSPGIQPQSGRITPLGGIGDVFGFKEMAFGEVSTATGNPYIAIALGAIAGKFSASSAIKSGSSGIPKGFEEVKEFGKSHGQRIFQKGGRYISRDFGQKDGSSHNGGVWKEFKKTGNRLQRTGTLDGNLKRIKD